MTTSPPATDPGAPASPRRPRRRGAVYALVAATLIIFALAVAAALGAFSSGSSSPAGQPAAALTPAPDLGDTSLGGQPVPRPTSTPSVAPSTTPAPPAFPEPFSAVSAADPVAVMRAALTSVFTYLPGDTTQLDAARRAAPLIAPPGVDDGFMTLAPITGGQWSQWRHDKVTVTAQANVPVAGDNPDTAAVATRVASVIQRVVNSRGQVVDTLAPVAVYVTARHQPTGQWQISKVTVR